MTKGKLFGAMLGGSMFFVTGCTNMEEMPGPADGNDAKVCTMEYKPVCGGKGYKRKTFGNACQAQAEGYSVIKEGPCV